MKFAVSVILCTYNRAPHLRRALESLRGLDQSKTGAWELIVVDNNSSDDTKAIVEECQQDFPAIVRYLFCGTQGKSHALNAGIAAAQGDLLVFTDDDVTFDAQWLNALHAAMTASEAIGIAGRIIPAWDRPPPRWYSEDGPYRFMTAVVLRYDLGPSRCLVDSTNPPYGANMAFRRGAFERHGVFRTDLGPFGEALLPGEDTEFGRRLLAAGERIEYAPGALVYHPVEPERLKKSYFLRWYYDYGRSITRVERPPLNSVRYFGVPRYALRTLGTNLLFWLTAVGAKRRFYYKAMTYLTCGSIAEWFSFRRSTQGDPPAGSG